MATFHLTVKWISRSEGRSAVASAAYRSAAKLTDDRTGKTYDYRSKGDLYHSDVLLPAGAPDRLADRSTLWNEVEAIERRKDSQLAREVEFMLPRELDDAAAIELARSFVQEAFVSQGMIADMNLHKPVGQDGLPTPHAHVMLTLRSVGPDGFGLKEKSWQAWRDPSMLKGWRELLATRTNEALARHGHDARVDCRSFRDRGIELQPQAKRGPTVAKLEARGVPTDRDREMRTSTEHNGKLLTSQPWLGLDFLTEHQSTFTKADIGRFVSRNTADQQQFAVVMAKIMTHPDLVRVGTGKHGEERYSTRQMVAIERRMAEHAATLDGTRGHGLPYAPIQRADTAETVHPLGPEQRAALGHLLNAGDLKLVTGYAGSGKSRLLGHARERWEAAGYRVRGAALSGIAAESLEGGSGIKSRTLHSLEWAWSQDREKLTPRDVLVIDEAGLVGSRQMERVLKAAQTAGSKVVLVGDPEQLQAIEAGAPFRLFAERHGCVHLTAVVRQQGKHASWMREATKELATGRTALALDRYEQAGMVHASDTRAEAMEALAERWDRDRLHMPQRSQLILAYTRADVATLNDLARQGMRRSGSLEGEDVAIATTRGVRAVAKGDRLMFLANDRDLGVKNGTLGTLQEVKGSQLAIELDDGSKVGGGRVVNVDLKAYQALDHGYATTVHKSQGATVGRSYVMAGKAFDRHAAYVAMTRHRGRADVHFAREDFQDRSALMRTMARERTKDVTQDYERGSTMDRMQQAALETRARAEAVRRLEPQGGQARGAMAAMRAAMEKIKARSREQERGI